MSVSIHGSREYSVWAHWIRKIFFTILHNFKLDNLIPRIWTFKIKKKFQLC